MGNHDSGIYAEAGTLVCFKINPFLSVCCFPSFSALLQVYADLFSIYVRSGTEVWDFPGPFSGHKTASPVPSLS
jgi:hypothetical protein